MWHPEMQHLLVMGDQMNFMAHLLLACVHISRLGFCMRGHRVNGVNILTNRCNSQGRQAQMI